MTASPRVRRMVMFKHGVAYVERSGPADASFELSFRRDEMNDVLKSLAVWVSSGDARVERVSFDAPEDAKEALAARGLALAEGEALSGILRALRGRRVRVVIDGETIEGDVIGVERMAAGDEGEKRTLVLRRSKGALAMFDLNRVASVEAIEEASSNALDFLVEKSRAATSAEQKSVRVHLLGTAEDLRVAYVIPSPVWRVSYRLVRDGETTLLMAQGIVHNPADEHVEDIELTLTTGQPVSFIIDLYKPKHVQRAVVEERSRAVAKPTQYERAMPPPAAPASFGPPPPPAGGAPMMRAAAPARPQAMADAMVDSMGDAATGADRGEHFEYRLPHPIGMSRGGSAMVPLLAAKLEAARERIWREGQGENPDLVISFRNTTGAVLEEGAAVLYDEGVYAGEAMLPYSARGSEVRMAFAKDLAVRCRKESEIQSAISGIRLANVALIEEQRREERHKLVAENDQSSEIAVVFEISKRDNRTVDERYAKPFEETAHFRRFRCTVGPHAKAEVIVVERWLETRNVRYEQLAARDLVPWMEGRFLDRATYDALSIVLNAWAHAKSLDEQRARVEREQGEAYTKQQKLAEQLNVLKEGGPEGALRLRYVKELEKEQDKVNASETEIRKLRESAEQARSYATQTLQQIVAAGTTRP